MYNIVTGRSYKMLNCCPHTHTHTHTHTYTHHTHTHAHTHVHTILYTLNYKTQAFLHAVSREIILS